MIGLALLLGLAGAPQLDLPVACTPGRDCWVQKLVDIDPSPARRDFRCGTLTTDGHDGVDFRLPSHAAMAAGVDVRAAADGRVLRVRDGEQDRSVRDGAGTGGRDAGNGVVIDHGGGWETQYSHLRQGSIAVRPGARVRRGAVLGRVGLSGNTEYPHLHFSVRQAGAARDPFSGRVPDGRCGDPTTPLWSAPAQAALAAPGPAVVRATLTRKPYGPNDIGAGDPPAPLRAEPLILALEAIAAQPGDTQTFRITGPDGRILLDRTIATGSGGLSWVGYAGLRPPGGAWRAGRYTGDVRLLRAGKEIGRATVAAEVR